MHNTKFGEILMDGVKVQFRRDSSPRNSKIGEIIAERGAWYAIETFADGTYIVNLSEITAVVDDHGKWVTG